MKRSGRRYGPAMGMISIGALAWGWWAWQEDQKYQGAIMAIELEMANGRFGIAARDLNNLIQRGSDAGEAAILLGRCEQERGRLKAAADALARVTPGSQLSHKALLARMRLLHDQGQFAAAEQLINDAAEDPRNDRCARANAACPDLQPARPARGSAGPARGVVGTPE